MSKAKQPKTKQLAGGRPWMECTIYENGWDSKCGDFRIIPAKGGRGWLLIAFEHDPLPESGQEFWVKRFSNLEAAMEHAELM